jgi:hypothetical protein
MENQQSNTNPSTSHAFCNDRIEALERYIVELEEKNAYLALANENLATQRDAAMTRAKEKGERGAEVIKAYRVALQFGVMMCKTLPDNLAKAESTCGCGPDGCSRCDVYVVARGFINEFLDLANHALSFRRDSNEQR